MNPAVYYLSGLESYPDYVPTPITIGGQIWDQKNLSTARYRDGSAIPRTTSWNNATTGIWRYYNDSSTNGGIYGRLYNWYAMLGIYDAASLSNPALRKNIAPVGWRVATDADWEQLASYVTTIIPTGNVGGKLKSTGTTLWASPNTGATNSTGFTALPGGVKAGADGVFSGLTLTGSWYTYNESTTTARTLNYNSGSLTTNVPGSPNPSGGRSIRLIKEDIVIPGFTTTEASNVAVQSATSGGLFSNLPLTPSLSDKGICWGTGGYPNIVTDSFISAGSGTTPNPYSIDITGLTPGVTYNIRAYATLSDGSGTAYAPIVSFTTPNGYPTVTTDAISNITGTTATGGGNVTSDGGFTITARGVCWNTATNPTIANSKTVDGNTIGAFTSSLTGLSTVTPYYVRAYATNSYGLTSYGSEVTFTTPAETVLLHAYSLRRVVDGYTGPAVRVRKGASTTLFQDIGFAAGTDDLDQVALLNFIGANNVGYVQTWYDQTGSGKNAVSGVTATREPIIVNSGAVVGTVVLKNGRPATTWGSAVSGNGISFLTISSTSIKVNNTSLFMVCANTSTVAQRGIYYGGTDAAPATIFFRPNGTGSDVLYYNAANRINLGTTTSTNKIYSMLSTATGVRAWKNNVEIGTGVNVTNTTTATTVTIGMSGAATERFTGTIQEMLFYVGDLAPTGVTSRTSITAAAIGYYSIT